MTDTNDDARSEAQSNDRLSTGIPGLDEVLHGGLVPNRSYLVRGDPGTGKTILGMHYLTEGAANGEKALYINLEEATSNIRQNAASLGFDLGDVDFLDLSPTSEFFAEDGSYDVFETSEVERSPMTTQITERVRDLEPDRVFVDPITQLRFLTSDAYQFRKQALSFMQLITERAATVLFTTQATSSTTDEDLQFMCDGTIELAHSSTGRTIDVPKFRGSAIERGDHAMIVTENGLVVYPELIPGEHASEFVEEPISSGVRGVDELLSGGLDRGTVTVVSGPTGVGKTTTGTQFMKEAANRGERSVMYLFEESEKTFIQRSESVGIPVSEMRDRGTLTVEEVEPLQTSPQAFADRVRREVEEKGTEIVMIDGISGYKLGLQGAEDELVTHLHALNKYLKNMGVSVILVDEMPNITGEFRATNVGISYLADNIVFLRHLEVRGEMRKVIGVLKMRTSDFERTLREFEITENGISVGAPLTDLRGILSGSPEWHEGPASNRLDE